VFRVASSTKDGGGHMMRCLSLARELIKYAPVHFLLCHKSEYWSKKITDQGVTSGVYNSPDDIYKSNLLVDGYHFSDVEINKWRRKCNKMVIISDSDNIKGGADIFVVSPGIKIDQSSLLKGVILHGSEYALLAPEYAKNIPACNAKYVKNILVTCGLSDSKNFIGSALEALSKVNFCGDVSVAIGRKAPHVNKLLNTIGNYNFSVNLVLDSDNLHDLVSKSDMIIGTGGVSLLERMALGKPSVTIIAAENQRNQVEWSKSIGATIMIDPLDEKFQYNLECAIECLIQSLIKRSNLGSRGGRYVDGKGCKRVAKYMAF
jgi:UDP-2,4-diacetamido-2,4,6-trideoxy-beta-L-altropyranose hydrolase